MTNDRLTQAESLLRLVLEDDGMGTRTLIREFLSNVVEPKADAWRACVGCPTPGDCRMHGCGVTRGLWTLPVNRGGEVSVFNVVELLADEDEQEAAPCKYGNIVSGHACYCHRDDWPEGPRKCPVWRSFGTSDLSKWHAREWPLQDALVEFGRNDQGETWERYEPRRFMPDDDLGGCPMFEPAEAK